MHVDEATRIARKVLAEFCFGLSDTPSLIDRTWTIPYVRGFRRTSAPIAESDSVSFEAELRAYLQSRANQYSDPQRLEMMDALLRQATELRKELGNLPSEPDKYPPSSPMGSISKRYIDVAHALDLLLGAEKELVDKHKEGEWATKTVDGRTGCEIVHLLEPLKKLLQKRGEGMPQQKH